MHEGHEGNSSGAGATPCCTVSVVRNAGALGSAAKLYLAVEGEVGGEPVRLLLTAAEVDGAWERAAKNPEDFSEATDMSLTQFMVMNSRWARPPFVEDTPPDVDPPDEPPPPDPSGTYDRVVQDETLAGNTYVPEGENWLFVGAVDIDGNLICEAGTVTMRAGLHLRIVGADPDLYRGALASDGEANLTWDENLYSNDRGIWIGHNGLLDIQGTPKVRWNTTGSDASWGADDQLWVTPDPDDPEDYTARRWYPEGHPDHVPLKRYPIAADVVARIESDLASWEIPQDWLDNGIPQAVQNVTADIIIEGPGHIHIHPHAHPQILKDFLLYKMGVSNSAFEGPVLGRYAIHLHHGNAASAGHFMEGIAALDCRGRVLVPHETTGVTITNICSVRSYAEVLWWDELDESHDIDASFICVNGVNMPRSVSGATSRFSGIAHTGGTGLSLTDSYVAGVRGSDLSVGYDWPSKADNEHPGLWTFQRNVAANCEGPGIRFWFNSRSRHVTETSICFNCAFGGVEDGAYSNVQSYYNVLTFDRWIAHANSKTHDTEGTGKEWFDLIVDVRGKGTAAMHLKRQRLEPTSHTLVRDSRFFVDPGEPKIMWNDNDAAQHTLMTFRHCDMTPADLEFSFASPWPAAVDGSVFRIEHEDGRIWETVLDVAIEQAITTQIA